MHLKAYKSYLFVISHLLILGLTTQLLAGVTGKIRGQVVDKGTGDVLPGANVLIESTTRGAATNTRGAYQILNVPPGSYNVIVQMIGYQNVKKIGVIVRTDFTTAVDFSLNQIVLEVGATLEIVAERPLVRKDQTSSLAELSGEEIRALPVEDYRDVLALQAGVTVSPNGAIHIRGGRSSEVTYVVDGITITDSYSGLPAVQVENNAIQELSLVSGAFNAEYGQALSGIVNIITREGGDHWQYAFEGYSGDYLSSDDDRFLNIEKLSATAVSDLQASAGGPLPFGLKLFASARAFNNQGWIYGRRDFNIADSTDLNSQNQEDWFVRQTGDGALVPMNGFERLSLQAKLAKSFGDKKFAYSVLWNDADFQDYSHRFKFTPDGNYNQTQRGLAHAAHFTQTFSSNAFLNIRYGYTSNKYRFFVFDDSLDPRYVDPDRLNIPQFRFYTGGAGMAHLRRETQTHSAGVNLTWQVNLFHQLKTGLQAKKYELSLREFTIEPARDANGLEFRPFQPSVPATSAIGSNEYTRKPLEISAFAQDKIELDAVVINAGLRLDYFDSGFEIASNSGDPKNSTKKAADVKIQFSPRFGIAYPLTDAGILHFSFGLFFQMPPFQYLYSNPEFEVAPGALRTTMGNADLKPQKTTIYELGLQQQFSDNVAADFTLYVKDIRNLLGQEVFRLDNDPSSKYVRYANRDYGNVKGLSLFLERRMAGLWGASLNYTYQVARGNASDPNALFFDLLANPPRESEKNVVTLDWDQRHTLNGTVTFGQPGQWLLSLIGSYGSGLPYTPTFQNQRTAFENSDRKPATLNLDLRAKYHFDLGGLRVGVFTKIDNVLNRSNEIQVFNDTGRAGYTLQGQFVGNTGLYSIDEYSKRPDFFSEPRRVVFGLQFSN